VLVAVPQNASSGPEFEQPGAEVPGYRGDAAAAVFGGFENANLEIFPQTAAKRIFFSFEIKILYQTWCGKPSARPTFEKTNSPFGQMVQIIPLTF
jgi:hypothetical protein